MKKVLVLTLAVAFLAATAGSVMAGGKFSFSDSVVDDLLVTGGIFTTKSLEMKVENDAEFDYNSSSYTGSGMNAVVTGEDATGVKITTGDVESEKVVGIDVASTDITYTGMDSNTEVEVTGVEADDAAFIIGGMDVTDEEVEIENNTDVNIIENNIQDTGSNLLATGEDLEDGEITTGKSKFSSRNEIFVGWSKMVRNP